MRLIECEQGSAEWHAARAGCITASMVEKKTRERRQPSRAVATHHGEKPMGYDERNTQEGGAQ